MQWDLTDRTAHSRTLTIGGCPTVCSEPGRARPYHPTDGVPGTHYCGGDTLRAVPRRALLVGVLALTLGGVLAASVTGADTRAGGPCAGATPARWKPWSNELRGDVTGDGRMDTVFVGQRYPEKPICRRLLFVETATKLLVEPLTLGSLQGMWWDGRTPAPVALADIDRYAGAEVVVRMMAPRQTEFWAVYTVRRGKIVSYRMPPHWYLANMFNIGGWDAAGHEGAAALDCRGSQSGLVAYSEAEQWPAAAPPSNRTRWRLVTTVLRAVGLRFHTIRVNHAIVSRLPRPFTRPLGSCLVAHNWKADIPHNPKEPWPG